MGDFDGDGKTDFLVYNQVTGTIGIDWANNGLGGLETYLTYFDAPGTGGFSMQRAPQEPEPTVQPQALSLSLRQNPARGSPGISFTLPQESDVSLCVYDVSGRKITTLVSTRLSAGAHTASWSGTGRLAGVYLIRLVSQHGALTKKLVLLD
jgi:hypothetical protein